ncbi:MAG: DNA polymerase I [Nitrospina sp.]|jgi:DNA polymerase I|nr:DNA polymerase I [Nitrospina sp.]MBT3876827.1 DNA polymerase I [Nitrospina sp.]MBT4048183.1 DNA polymerase I [Nitrospina sp.]MBT4556869.1 DNA polymerase I [Nitrospina sp.]MBT5349681.1 DNA polymerase I [Nitrospina sp.]
MTKPKSLYLIDGSSYIFRAYYGIRQFLSTSKGFPTNALYGFINMLQKVVRDEKPDYLAVAFDSKEKTFRHQMYADYKANREAPPEDLAKQFPFFEPLVQAFNIHSVRVPGFEADDIMGTLAKRGVEKGLQVVIVSGDKDMMQLVGSEIRMLDTMKNKWFGIEEVKEKFGVTPERVIDVMGLMGDSSDHIPGVKGVGPKTASELIAKFGSINELYERIDEVEKKKLKEKLVQDKEMALLSRQLVTIDTSMKLEFDLKNLELKPSNNAELKKLFSDFEFSSMLGELEDNSEPVMESPVINKQYEAILTEDDFERWIKKLQKSKIFALDLETTSLRPVRAQVVGISFSYEAGVACYIPLTHRYLGVPDQLQLDWVLNKLKPLLEDPKIKKVGQNIKYDLIVLRNEGISLQGVSFDTMLASYILNPSGRRHNMDDLAQDYLGHTTIKYKDVVGTASKEIGFDEVDIERATNYAAEDADITWRLYEKLKPLLQADDLKIFEELEVPLLEVLAEMEIHGMKLDKDHLQNLSKLIQKKIEDYVKKIYSSAGEEFNINSPKQLSVILFEKLGLTVIKKTKSGFSTDVSVLEQLAEEHDLPELILSYRQLGKLKSTYVDALQEEIFSKTGRVHTSFNQTVAATGRLSSSNPNLQNIPIRTEMGREIRKAFIAEGNNHLLSADYSQVELRILAHLSDDEALVEAFQLGEDIHTRTAMEIFGTSEDRLDAEARRMAKAVNFGIVYGLSAFGLSRQLKIFPKDAKKFIDQYFALYKKVKIYMDETVAQATEVGYTLTMLNRKRYLPDLKSKNRQVREAAGRVAINSPVQGSAADLIKLAMIQLAGKIREKKLKSRMILQVHDELVFECPEEEKQEIQALVKKEMEEVVPLKVPLVVDMGWGENWNTAHC